MKWGGKLEFLQHIARKGEAVTALESMPVLPPEYWPWRDAFLALHRSRQYGMGGPNPIAMTEIAAYWHWFRPDDDAAMFLHLMQATDQAFLEVMNQKAEKERKHGG